MSTIFQNLLRRLGFEKQIRRPATRRPPIRLCLEALDERLLPSATAINPAALEPISMRYANLQVLPIQFPSISLPPTPNLMGPMGKGSTIDLGNGTLTIATETYDRQAGVVRFTGQFESHSHVYPAGISVSDDIGPYNVSGTIGTGRSAVGTTNVNGTPVNYYTNPISFQGTGDGQVGALMLPDHQQVSFSGSVLSLWSPNASLPVGVSGSLDIQDWVTLPAVNQPQYFDNYLATVPGTTVLGTSWASVTFIT